MRTISFMSQKGGSGKTTLAVHVAVAAQESGENVILFDTDYQKSATAWSESRGEDKNVPVITAPAFEVERLTRVAEESGYTLVVVDTAPHAVPDASKVARASDLVVIPCRPSAFDIRTTETSVKMAQAGCSNIVFVLSACPPGCPEIRETYDVLAEYELPICPVEVIERRGYFRAIPTGRAVTEFDPKGKAAEEVRNLWKWLKERMQ